MNSLEYNQPTGENEHSCCQKHVWTDMCSDMAPKKLVSYRLWDKKCNVVTHTQTQSLEQPFKCLECLRLDRIGWWIIYVCIIVIQGKISPSSICLFAGSKY